MSTVIGRVLRLVKHDEIYHHLNNNIDVGYVYTSDWERECRHVVNYLNRLIQKKYRDASSCMQDEVSNQYDDARAVLTVPNTENGIRALLRDLDRCYFPVLERVW